MRKVIKGSYRKFLAEIKCKIRNDQYNTMKQVNLSLLKLYWDIGKSIVEKQNKWGWGKSVVETLSKDLQDEFPGVNGYFVQKTVVYVVNVPEIQGEHKIPTAGWRN